jgi:hypothetical protein
MKTTTLPLRNLMNRSPLCAFLLIPLVLVCVALSPQARAVCQEGCLTNENTALGDDALLNNTTSFDNTAIGFNALFRNTTGDSNTATGSYALSNNRRGVGNTATGEGALNSNTWGSNNTATGKGALYSNRTAPQNTATGYNALYLNTIGSGNTATGYNALYSNTTGSQNTAIGIFALTDNTTGSDNTASGTGALEFNTTGNNNTATGKWALFDNTIGSGNTATGELALVSNTTGSDNAGIGGRSLLHNTTGKNNTASGAQALMNNTSGSFNVAVGSASGGDVTSADNVICIGANVRGANLSNSCFIGNIREVTTINGDAIPVLIDSAGQLGTASSSRRFKKEIKPMDQTSEAILALKPVTFHYKSDTKGTPQFGLIAEQVAEVNPDLVVRDENGEIYTVRYEEVNAMLLNEFLKEHKKVEEQQATIAELKSTVAQQHKAFQSRLAEQQKQIEALTAGLQKVSAQVEMSRPASQTVVDNH